MGFLKPNVAKLEERRDIDGLIRVLKERAPSAKHVNDHIARAEAAHALSRIGDTAAVETLIEALDDPFAGGAAAATARGKIGDTRAVAPLIRAMQAAPGESNRSWAAEALGMIGDPRAVEPLAEALAVDGSRFKAAIALSKFGDGRATEHLVLFLASGIPAIRLDAAEALARLGDDRGVERLIEDLGDPSTMVRRWAADSLGRIGDPRALPAIQRAIEGVDAEIARQPKDTLLVERRDAMAAAGRELLEAAAAKLTSLKTQLESLPSKHPATATVAGPGLEQAEEQVPIICRNIDDAIISLRTGRESGGAPVSLWQVGTGLQDLVGDVSGAGFSGLMLAILSPEGVREIERLVAELGDLAVQLCQG